LPQCKLSTHYYEEATPFLATPSGTTTGATSAESQGTPNSKLSMSGYFYFSLNIPSKHEFTTNVEYMMETRGLL
jgi:hypothetical protein